MKITDAKIDPATFGNKMWLVDVKPAYAYENNHRTDTVIGYRYIVAPAGTWFGQGQHPHRRCQAYGRTQRLR